MIRLTFLFLSSDFRRHVRPFFLTPQGNPTPNKKYYDIFSYLVTQTAFCFTTVPFCLLSLPDSLKVWARVYFYCVIGTAACVAFFSSPGKIWLIKQLKARNEGLLKKDKENEKEKEKERRPPPPPLVRADTNGDQNVSFVGPGLPDDLEKEVSQAAQEIKEEVESMRARGASISMPTGADMKAAVENKLGKRLN